MNTTKPHKSFHYYYFDFLSFLRLAETLYSSAGRCFGVRSLIPWHCNLVEVVSCGTWLSHIKQRLPRRNVKPSTQFTCFVILRTDLGSPKDTQSSWDGAFKPCWTVNQSEMLQLAVCCGMDMANAWRALAEFGQFVARFIILFVRMCESGKRAVLYPFHERCILVTHEKNANIN